ncbi:hypothetical protein GY45DRAFT_1264031, partial [Cubamyces sp. BRFM 1775]
MSQEDITRTIDAIGLDDVANEKAYIEAKLCKLRLSKLEQLHDDGDSITAMKLLRQKNYLHIDSKYMVKPDLPDVVWFQNDMRLDYRQVVGRAGGIDMLLPNWDNDEARVDHVWTITIGWEKRHWHFRGDRRALGCDMAGRMLHIGWTIAQESVWLGLIPKEVYNNPPHVHDVRVSKQSTTMDPVLSRVMIAYLLHVMYKSHYSDIVLVNDYPDVSSDKAFMKAFDMRSRNRFEFGNVDFLAFCKAFKDNWDPYFSNAPESYRFPELLDSLPIAVTLKYGQNAQCALTGVEADAAAANWAKEYNYSHIWRMCVGLATHYSAFRAREWEEISVFDIYDDHPAVYLSPDGHNRQPVDLHELPLLDEHGAEVLIFSEDGMRIPRRRAVGLTNMTRLSIMQNLAKVSSLFVTSGPDADAMAVDDEFDDAFDDALNVNDADYELNLENARARERRDVRDTKYTLYPHFFSKTIGQWQSTGVIHAMLPHIRNLSSSLTHPDAAGHAIVALSSQCYNTSAHAMRDRSRFHVVQQGMLTGAAGGPWSTTEKGKATGKTLWNKISYALPHEHVTAQLERDPGMYNSLRFENNLLIDFNHVRDDVRDGYLFYRDFVLPYAQLCTRPQIVNALRDTSVLFPYGVFPEIYSWAAYPVTSLLTATWKRYVNPFFGPVPHVRRQVHPNDRKPKPHYIEFLACLERLLNFGYTGNAQVLPTRLMREIWAGRGIVDQGFPFLWPGLTWNADRCYPLAISLQRWPVHPATERPLTASKCAQVITYGLPHYLAYETVFYMQSRLARLDRANAMRARRGEKPVWEDASPMGKKLRLLAQIALRSFTEDTVSLVAEQVSDEIQPILRAGDSEEYIDARRRSQALKSWARQEFPLDSTDEGATFILLSNIVCANSAHAARGLPKSSRGQWSRADFVNHLMTVATSTSRATIRPPVWNKGQFWPVLRAAVEEGRNVVRRDLSAPDIDYEPSDDEALSAIKEAFTFIANEQRIGLVPDAVLLPSGRMSTEPSIRAWTNMGPLPRQSQTVQATLLTSRQRDERQLAEVARAMAEENPGTVWTTVTTTI